MTFHDLFHDLFLFSMTLSLTVTFENSQNYPCFRVKFALFFAISGLCQNMCSSNCPESICMGGYCSVTRLYYNFVLVLTSAVTNTPGLTITFPYFPWPTIIFHDFPGLENKILEFHDSPGFHWPIQALINYKVFNNNFNSHVTILTGKDALHRNYRRSGHSLPLLHPSTQTDSIHR